MPTRVHTRLAPDMPVSTTPRLFLAGDSDARGDPLKWHRQHARTHPASGATSDRRTTKSKEGLDWP